MTVTAIGFANKFYTLWQITEDTKPLGNGRSYVITNYTFIKNISFDKGVALSKYPEAIFDENLRGKTISWETKKEVWDNVDTFRFGKYNGQKINETDDVDYIAWYWNQIGGDHREFVSNVLKEYGYEVHTYTYENYYGETKTGKNLLSPEVLENMRKVATELEILLEKCKNNEVFEFVPTKNLDYNGEFRDGNIIYRFENFKLMEYAGNEYGLPLDSKGKAKRIKNKNIKITKYIYTVNDDNTLLTITCKDFEIMK